MQALNWVINLGLDKVVFETDCKVVADFINSPRESISELGNVLSQCSSLPSSLPLSKVEFVRRQANGVVYNLVRAALSKSSPHFLHQVSLCIAQLIYNEMLLVLFRQKKKKRTCDVSFHNKN